MEVIRLEHQIDDAIKIILDGIKAFNRSHLGVKGIQIVIGVLDDDGQIKGGAIAYALKEMLIVDLMWLPDEIRGQGIGRRVIKELENQGRNHNCHFITLDTFTFQSPGFYQKLGFYEYGRVPKYMLGHDRIYYKKEL